MLDSPLRKKGILKKQQIALQQKKAAAIHLGKQGKQKQTYDIGMSH
jgi:hypothetical protein